jgi:hypothetical protein
MLNRALRLLGRDALGYYGLLWDMRLTIAENRSAGSHLIRSKIEQRDTPRTAADPRVSSSYPVFRTLQFLNLKDAASVNCKASSNRSKKQKRDLRGFRKVRDEWKVG